MSSFLIDMPLSPLLVPWLSERGHDAVHASRIGLSFAPDDAILARARDEGRIIITADLDFPQLLALSGAASPGVVLFRGGTFSEAQVRAMLEWLLTTRDPASLENAVTVVEPGRIRVTRLPLRGSDD